MSNLDKVTVHPKNIEVLFCESCGTLTVHLFAKDRPSVCVQCLVDVHDVAGWSRWIDPVTKQRLNDPWGKSL